MYMYSLNDNDWLRGTGNKSSIISMALFNLTRQINHLFSSYDSQKFDSSNDSQIFSLCLACYRTQNKFICLISLSNFHTLNLWLHAKIMKCRSHGILTIQLSWKYCFKILWLTFQFQLLTSPLQLVPLDHHFQLDQSQVLSRWVEQWCLRLVHRIFHSTEGSSFSAQFYFCRFVSHQF